MSRNNIRYLLSAVISLTLLATFALIGTARNKSQAAAELAPIACTDNMSCGEYGQCDPKYHVCRTAISVLHTVDTKTGKIETHVKEALVLAAAGQTQPKQCLEPPPNIPCGYAEKDEAQEVGDGDGQKFQEDAGMMYLDTSYDGHDYPSPPYQ